MRTAQSKQSHLMYFGGGVFMIQNHLSAKDFFLKLNSQSMNLVDEFYDKDVYFRDPIVEINNRRQIKEYYAKMYNNVQSIAWQIQDEIVDHNQCVLVWTMILSAKNFNGNKPLHLDGTSVIKFGGKEGKAIYHRDYFDMGAFVYEGLPILGGMVKFVKQKMAAHHNESHLAGAEN